MSKAPPGIELTGVLADLARINIRYLLEWRAINGNILKRSISLPLPPQALNFEQPENHLITHTLGDTPIREIGKHHHHVITIDGQAGYDVRVGYNRKGAITSLFGQELLTEFKHFLKEYQEATVEDTQYILGGKLKNANELIFRALDESLHYKVEVSSFQIQRDASQYNFSPRFTLKLEAYADAEKPPRPFEDIQSKIDAVSSAIDTAGASVGAVSSVINGSNVLSRRFLEPLNRLQTITNALEEAIEGVSDVLSIPLDLMNTLSNTALSTKQSALSLINNVLLYPDKLSRSYKQLENIIGGADEIQLQADSILGAIYNETTKEEPVGNLYTAPPPSTYQSVQPENRQPITIYRLRVGESLYTLSLRIFGTPERWNEIADLNGWIDAYHLPSGRPAQAGDALFIPSTDDQDNAQEIDPYGTDLRLKDGDLILTESDLSLISGPPNIEQALTVRLHTENGETPVLLNYGLPKTIGTRINAQTAGYLASFIREQILTDTRINEILVLELKDQGDQLTADIQMKTKNSAYLPLNLKVH